MTQFDCQALAVRGHGHGMQQCHHHPVGQLPLPDVPFSSSSPSDMGLSTQMASESSPGG